ncbi:MAG TPA: serpin family protein [Anaerolineae bacterium]|nr:serpin family protein [Anaerolineae bacterium]
MMKPQPEDVASGLTELVEGNTAFALDLLQQLGGEPGNVFFSPFSISAALAMTYAGARGETERQMASTLHFTLGQGRLHPAFASLLGRMVEVGAAGHLRLHIANSLWPQAGYRFLDDYLAACRAHYGVTVRALDYATDPEECRRRINGWAERQTEGRIRDLIPPCIPDALTRLVLANAVYFKGRWLTPFDEQRTEQAAFHLAAGAQVSAPMMGHKCTLGYASLDGLQVLELPYAGGDLSMIVLLPNEVSGLPELERRLTPPRLAGWLGQLARREVQVWLPRFRLELKIVLNRMLARLGMPDAFDADRADFSGMDGRVRWLYMAFAVHQAAVDVSEEGTEAAAATAVLIKARSLPPAVPEFRADHPFLFLIHERATGAILFLGRVANPLGGGPQDG